MALFRCGTSSGNVPVAYGIKTDNSVVTLPISNNSISWTVADSIRNVVIENINTISGTISPESGSSANKWATKVDLTAGSVTRTNFQTYDYTASGNCNVFLLETETTSTKTSGTLSFT